MAEVIGVLMLLLARPLLSFFTKNQAAIAVGERQIQVEALFFCMLSFSHCIAAIMRGAGRPMVPMFVMLGAWCVLRVTYISVVVPLVGESWVIFSAYPLTWTVSSIVFLLFYLKSDWIHGFDKERAPAGRISKTAGFRKTCRFCRCMERSDAAWPRCALAMARN